MTKARYYGSQKRERADAGQIMTSSSEGAHGTEKRVTAETVRRNNNALC